MQSGSPPVIYGDGGCYATCNHGGGSAVVALLAVGLAVLSPGPACSRRRGPMRRVPSHSARRSAARACSTAPTTSSKCRRTGGGVSSCSRTASSAARGRAPSRGRRSRATSSREGHAWVASGYRAREYQPHLFIEDLVALRELFVKEIGQPRWTIIYGQSMGGHIVVASLELRPGLYQGGLAECGLVDGISIADYLCAYTAAAELISGVPLLDAPDRRPSPRSSTSASCRRSACRARTPRADDSSTAS